MRHTQGECQVTGAAETQILYASQIVGMNRSRIDDVVMEHNYESEFSRKLINNVRHKSILQYLSLEVTVFYERI